MNSMQDHFADNAEHVWQHEADQMRADLMPCVLQFNQLTTDGVHPSWLAADEVFWREHVHAFKQMESRLRVSNWLRDRFKLNDCYDDQFQNPHKRVYLIPVQPFQQLTLCLGASLCVSTLRKQLMRTQVMSLRDTLGESVVRQLFSCFHDGYHVGVDLLATSDQLHVDKLYSIGAQALLTGAQTFGDAVMRRTQLKLRRQCAEVDEILICVRDTSLLHEHVMMVAMLFVPDWNSLFTQSDQEMAA
ncbi:MAG: SctK family type III secretion system sorting platform protein [Rhizobacter sp.]